MGKRTIVSGTKSIDDLGLRGKENSYNWYSKRLEELFYGDSIPLYLDKKKETLK
jgi:excinuclease ABC subunit C